MVIVILGILAAVAIPKYFDLQAEAHRAAEDGVVGAVRGGILTYFAKYRAFPPADGLGGSVAVCDTSNTCFTNIFEYPVTDGTWEKTAASTYKYIGDTSGGTYVYDNTNGTFD